MTGAKDWPDLSGRLAGDGATRRHVLPVRIYFEDTDFSGLVYHASYVRFCERGRSDFLRLLGNDHRALIDGRNGREPAITVADANLQLASDKINNSPFGFAVSFDITNEDKRGEYIRHADIVISMLPPFLHSKVANDCVKFSKHLLTASYVDDDLRSMKAEIENKKLLFLCEMGLDPGIDHMSAMKLIDHIHAKGGTITSFKSPRVPLMA